MAAVSLNTEHRKLKSGERVEYWYLRWYGPDGRRRGKCIGRTDELSKTKARRIRLRKMAELEWRPQRANVTRGLQLGPYIKNFLKTRASDLSPATIEGYKHATQKAVDYFGPGCLMERLTRPQARDYKASLATDKYARWTVETYLARIKSVFQQALDDDLITQNPFRGLGQSVAGDRDWHYVSPEEFHSLLGAARDGWVSILALCRLAGLRRAEAFHMQDRFIDRRNKTLQVIAHGTWAPKTKSSKRVVPLFRELQKILAGRKVKATILAHPNRDFKVLCKRAGVEPYSGPFQSLRKSCARDWAQQFPAHVVQQWLGHTSLITTGKYYLQVPPGEYKRAANMRMLEPKD